MRPHDERVELHRRARRLDLLQLRGRDASTVVVAGVSDRRREHLSDDAQRRAVGQVDVAAHVGVETAQLPRGQGDLARRFGQTPAQRDRSLGTLQVLDGEQ